MHLGVQYYRPPFPESGHWEDDLKRIRDSGLDTLQLWILWAWVESQPGIFVFDDYDRLVELAGQNGLKLVLSTIAEIQPQWIHREIPGSEMIDHRGHRVISSHRGECHFGLTPGGCTDHSKVWRRMAGFLTKVVTRYRGQEHLAGWDVWNELRWNVQADGLVCFCPHTIASFHHWLQQRYGDLEGLNRAWKRRYGRWDEVLPGKLPDRTHTEMMAWQHFISWRANQHGKARYDLVKKLDPLRPVTVHGGDPSPLTAGGAEEYALDRGNDWFYADDLDGVGCSSFPKLYAMDDASYLARVSFAKSAAGSKRLWLSEVQGGAAAIGFNVYPPVDAVSQQRWIWQGLALGAETLLFWCWRDEVFGRESAGFGMVGNDGLAEERLAAMRQTRMLFERNRDLLENYVPDPAEVGVFFSPQSYYLHWAQEGHAKRVRRAVEGYCRALVRQSIPHTVIEENHLDVLQNLKVLFLPRAIVTDERIEEALIRFVREGGTLVCESECGAFSPEGFYRQAADRFLSRLMPGSEVGRRALPETNLRVESPRFPVLALSPSQWVTPWKDFSGTTWAATPEGALVGEAAVGKGKVIYVGTYLGDDYLDGNASDFERFVGGIVRQAGHEALLEILDLPQKEESFFYVKTGRSKGRRVAFLFHPPGSGLETVHIKPGFFKGNEAVDLQSGRSFSLPIGKDDLQPTLNSSPWGVTVWADPPEIVDASKIVEKQCEPEMGKATGSTPLRTLIHARS